MLARPMEILTQFPDRKSKEQKQAFRDAVQDYLERIDYPVQAEAGILGSWNLVIGDPERAKYLVTAQYHTGSGRNTSSEVVTLLEIARILPENQRHKVCFVLLDLGCMGSLSHRKTYKEATDHQLVIHLNCVSEGDEIRLFPTKKLKQNPKRLTSLYKACGYMGKKSILVHEKGFAFNTSVPKDFPYGIGVCTLRKNKLCDYLALFQTQKSTILDETNINILRAALTTFICCDAVN